MCVSRTAALKGLIFNVVKWAPSRLDPSPLSLQAIMRSNAIFWFTTKSPLYAGWVLTNFSIQPGRSCRQLAFSVLLYYEIQVLRNLRICNIVTFDIIQVCSDKWNQPRKVVALPSHYFLPMHFLEIVFFKVLFFFACSHLYCQFT